VIRRWVRIKSFHILRDGVYRRTLCGRAWSDGLRSSVGSLPMDERSCEVCLRLALQADEKETTT